MSLTREQLKEKLKPIVCDLSLSVQERQDKLGPIFVEMIPASIRKEPKGIVLLEAFGDTWNSVMAEIVEESGLHG